MKLRSYSKRKSIDKMQQGFEDADAKANSDAKEMVTTAITPGFVEEISVVESMGTTSVPETKSPEIKKNYSQLRNTEDVRWRPKTMR